MNELSDRKNDLPMNFEVARKISDSWYSKPPADRVRVPPWAEYEYETQGFPSTATLSIGGVRRGVSEFFEKTIVMAMEYSIVPKALGTNADLPASAEHV